jgi:rare lipoprotein A
MMLGKKLVFLSSFALILAGCTNLGTRSARSPDPGPPPFKGGGYYKDDGPGANPPANLASVPDATPKEHPPHPYANDPYTVLGKRYKPLPSGKAYRAQGLASWYGRKFHGRPTSSGEPYDMYGMTAAHATLPIPSYVRVTNPDNGKSVVVKVNDRGPFHEDRLIDLSYTAAYKLDTLRNVTLVEVESVFPDDAPAPGSFAAGAVAKVAPEPAVRAAAVIRHAPAADASPATSVTYLQLGAFARAAGADALRAKLDQELAARLPGTLRTEADGLHKVQVGPFMLAAEADRAAQLIQDSLGLKSYKVSVAAPPASLPVSAPAEPVTPPAGGVYLQVAALSNPTAVDELVGRLRQEQDASLPGVHRVASNGLTKVQVGPFDSIALADKTALALEQSLGIRPYRVKH